MFKSVLLKAAIIFLVINTFHFAQDITFERLLSSLGRGTPSSLISPEGGYYFASQGFYTRLDKLGNIAWSTADTLQPKEYRTYFTQLIFTHNNNLLGLNVTGEEDNYNLLLTELDTSGKIIKHKIIEDNLQNLQACSLIKTDDGGYFVLGHVNESQKMMVYKLDGNLAISWEKIIDFHYLSFNKKVRIAHLSDGNFIIWGGGNLIKIDADANIIWRKDLVAIYDLRIKNSLIYVCHSSLIEKFNFDGNAIFGSIPVNSARGFTITDDGNIVYTQQYLLVKVDSLGNELWNSEHLGGGYFMEVQLSPDNGFFVSGSNSYTINKPWFLKTDKDGKFTSLNLTKPEGGEILGSFSEFEINWFTNKDFQLTIEFTSDGGIIWETLDDDFNSLNNSFNWIVPNIISNNCFVKLTNNSNPLIISQNPFPFSIAPVQFYDYIAANECLMWISNSGGGSHDPHTDGSGFYWPGGINATQWSVFQDGLFWGGYVNGNLRLNGNNYRDGIQPGAILTDGSAGDPNSPEFKIFKLKKNWEMLPDGAEKDRLQYDYNNWPVKYGAPVKDDGTPKLIGDETLFYVANDLDSNRTKFTYGTLPIGLEFQTTVYAYDSSNFLKDVVFKRYKIINKSDDDYNEVYLSYWTDDDLGEAGNDFVGCDTVLSLGYSYNAEEDDYVYGSPPPAVGHMFIQTPLMEADNNDSGFVGDKWVKGYKNAPLSSFVFYIGGSSVYSDPDLGVPQGAIEFHNNQKGLLWQGDNFLDPNTGDSVKFLLSGDPVAGTGWYEGDGWPGGAWGGDRRYLLSVGPFDFFAGDTQEVVVAIFMGQGNNRLESVTKLKETAAEIRSFYLGTPLTGIKENHANIPGNFRLEQNYPNPFNPATIIKYSIPKTGDLQKLIVHLNVFDILGREVRSLVNKAQTPGNYEVEFKATKLSSGVYFYNLRIESAGKVMFNKFRKMLLIK